MSAPKPVGPYTPIVRAGDWLIVSGQVGIEGRRRSPTAWPPRRPRPSRNVAAHLATEGASADRRGQDLCFLTDMGDFATFNEAYIAGFGDHRPARSTIGVAALPDRRRGRDRGVGVQAGVSPLPVGR